MKMSKLFSEWVGCSPVCPDLSISWMQKMILCMAVILREDAHALLLILNIPENHTARSWIICVDSHLLVPSMWRIYQTWDCCEPGLIAMLRCLLYISRWSALILGIWANTWKNCKLTAGIIFSKLRSHWAECNALFKLQHLVKFSIFW